MGFFQFKNICDKEEVCFKKKKNLANLSIFEGPKFSLSFEERLLLLICEEYMKY